MKFYLIGKRCGLAVTASGGRSRSRGGDAGSTGAMSVARGGRSRAARSNCLASVSKLETWLESQPFTSDTVLFSPRSLRCGFTTARDAILIDVTRKLSRLTTGSFAARTTVGGVRTNGVCDGCRTANAHLARGAGLERRRHGSARMTRGRIVERFFVAASLVAVRRAEPHEVTAACRQLTTTKAVTAVRRERPTIRSAARRLGGPELRAAG